VTVTAGAAMVFVRWLGLERTGKRPGWVGGWLAGAGAGPGWGGTGLRGRGVRGEGATGLRPCAECGWRGRL